ncbi:hypothetical protein [Nocardioides sp. 503]|uniref:hypothetical protein n=1 Tax=Nocardioides sp. 503 TaxID=2508326 RepID=UPI00106FAEEE|nr:hypothetical protein [Nocardioides sp. 503]
MREWGTEEWSTVAEIVAAVGTVAAAVVAAFTAWQARRAAEASQEAASTARRALALHFQPLGGYSLGDTSHGGVPWLLWDFHVPAPDRVLVRWQTSDGRLRERYGTRGALFELEGVTLAQGTEGDATSQGWLVLDELELRVHLGGAWWSLVVPVREIATSDGVLVRGVPDGHMAPFELVG